MADPTQLDKDLVCLFKTQSFFAGLAASGALTSGLRLITKAAFDKTENGLRKGVSKFTLFDIWTRFCFHNIGVTLGCNWCTTDTVQ